jgi:hypothetical protein
LIPMDDLKGPNRREDSLAEMQRREEEFRELARELEGISELFACLHKVGSPDFGEEFPTAAIAFSPTGEPLRFHFNGPWWDGLPHYDRTFVVCHEMLHVALRHGMRSRAMEDSRLANIAADLVVNHLLVEKFGFHRQLLQNPDRICWVDLIYPQTMPFPPTSLTMEQHYDRLTSRRISAELEPLDQHIFQRGQQGSLDSRRGPAEIDAILSGLSTEARREFLRKVGDHVGPFPGVNPGNDWASAAGARVPLVPWDQILTRRLRLNREVKEVSTWRKAPRRLAGFSETLLPSDQEEWVRTRSLENQEVVFFLDSSASVFSERAAFFAVARSLAQAGNRVTLCSFDTRVHELDIRTPMVAGGGGTSFEILEEWVQFRRRRGPGGLKPHPDAVVVITDGYGTPVHPEMPERWHWILTTDCQQCIPRQCRSVLTSRQPGVFGRTLG